MINLSKNAKSRRKTVGNKAAADMDSSRAALKNDKEIGLKAMMKSKSYMYG